MRVYDGHMARRHVLPVRLSPRPLSAMLDRFGRACESAVFYATLAAQGFVAGVFVLFLCLVPHVN